MAGLFRRDTSPEVSARTEVRSLRTPEDRCPYILLIYRNPAAENAAGGTVRLVR